MSADREIMVQIVVRRARPGEDPQPLIDLAVAGAKRAITTAITLEPGI